MNFRWWVDLPRRACESIRSGRAELAECHRLLEELARSTLALEGEHRALQAEIDLLRDTFLDEVREQGLLQITAAGFAARAAAEEKLRARLSAPARRTEGLSILVTCWNHAEHLERSVASAVASLAALRADGEVLILDDASRDGSREIAAELAKADARVRLIASHDNLGLPRARNVLLSQARCEHALILDSDNQLIPSGVAALYESARRTEAVLAYGNILNVDATGKCLDVLSNQRLTPAIRKCNWIDAMALLRTERILELGGYDGQWLYGLEDWELIQRLFALREPVLFVPVLMGRYSTLPGSMLRQAPTSIRRRLDERMFGTARHDDDARYRAGVHHPAIGTLWSSPGWSSVVPAATVAAGANIRPLRILVVTSGGVLNYGDDAILLSTLQRLQRLRPRSLATVISDGLHIPPLGRLGMWQGTCDEFLAGCAREDVRRGCRDDRALVAELTQYFPFGTARRSDVSSFDVVLFSGGGNLCQHFPEIIARRTAIAAAANAHGVPYILSGQGVGPIAAENLPMLSFLVRGATAAATRDPASLQLLRQIVPDAPRLSMVGDDALGLRCVDRDTARQYLAQCGVPVDRPLLVFQAREASYVGFSRAELEHTTRQVDEFAAAHGFAVVASPINMQTHGTEADLLAELMHSIPRRATWHLATPGGDVPLIAGIVKASHAVLTHSYHVAIFALEDRIPTLLFSGSKYYDLKAEALRAAFGIPASILATAEIPAAEIAVALERVAASTWARGMTSADVDAWFDDALPAVRNNAAAVGAPLTSLNVPAWRYDVGGFDPNAASA